jgi:hypothetical protein
VVNPISGTGTELPVADAIIYATDNGADIISMSLQYYDGTTALQNAVAYAYDSGVLRVANCCDREFSIRRHHRLSREVSQVHGGGRNQQA